MVTFGVDILILAILGGILAMTSWLIAVLVPLGEDEGVAAITATCATALIMIMGYAIMARVLDNMCGPLGW